jgi:NitT/TauT family transport system substrate-binding protein
MSWRKVACAMITALVALLSAAPGPVRAAGEESVTLAYPALSVSFALPYLAEDLALFEKEGLAVKHLDINGLGSINALIAGSVDFALASGLSLTRAAAKGQRLMAIAALHDRLFVQIVMRKSVADAAGFDPKAPLPKRAELLKNHVIAVDSINAVNHGYLRLIAKMGGMDPDDLKLAVIAPPSLLAAFASKQIDGFAMTPPWPEQPLVDGTGVLIASAPDGDPPELAPLANTVLLTRPDFCQKRESACEKMGRAITAASFIVRDHPDEALAALQKRFPTLDPKAMAEAFTVLRKITPVPPTPTLAAIRANDTFNIEAGLIKPEEALKSFDDLFTDKYVH